MTSPVFNINFTRLAEYNQMIGRGREEEEDLKKMLEENECVRMVLKIQEEYDQRQIKD